MEECTHHTHWRTDFALAAGLGIRTLRYGLPPRGLFDLDRKVRPVGEAYRKLIADWRVRLGA